MNHRSNLLQVTKLVNGERWDLNLNSLGPSSALTYTHMHVHTQAQKR